MSRILAALVVLTGAVALFVGAVFLYSGGATRTFEVVVKTDRIGLVLDENADVRMRGVVVGHVARVEQDQDGASVVLAVETARASAIPANAPVRIDSTTVFGAKYVAFVPPEAPSPNAIAAGAQVESTNVTVELDTVFQNLTSVLQSVQPQKLKEVLAAFSTTLRGRGDRLNGTIVSADRYVRDSNDRSGDLTNALDGADRASNIYADAAPDLVSVLANVTRLADTVVDQQVPLEETLAGLLGLGNSGGALFEDNAPTLSRTLQTLEPTTATLAEYSPVFPCLFNGFAFSGREGAPSYVGQPGIKLQAGLLPGASTYTAENNLPRVGASGGPNCVGLDNPNLEDHAPYLVTDINANPFNPLQRTPQVNADTFLDILYGVVPSGNAPTDLPAGGTR
ncbi:MAG: MCE family protein [Rhodococcus sp. (in: high G+C Gram-positive bacteria)]